MNDLDKIAAALLQQRTKDGSVGSEILIKLETVADAYRVQQATVSASGSTVAGWKVALPPDGETIAAPILALDVVRTGGSSERLDQLRSGVELEIAFRIDRALPARPPEGYGVDEAMAAIGAALPAFELLASRLPDGFASPRVQLVADCLGNGGAVLGSPREGWRNVDFTAIGVEVIIDGQSIITKRGGNPVGNPVRAVAALAEHLHRQGLTLEPGQFVMTGAYTGVHHLRPGQRIEGRFEGFAPVSFVVPPHMQTVQEDPSHAVR
jgi:2-keto-4-pentenoate hydratase